MRLSHPLFSGPQPSGGSVFDFRAHFCHSAPMETHAFGFRLRANAPEGQKRFPIRKSRELYDQHAASQRGAQPKTTAAPSMRNMQMGAWIRRALGAKANELASVVELGFGDAELSRVLASVLPQASIVACDIARDRVAAATELAAQLGLAQRVECRVLDFDSDLGLLHDGAADLVVSIDVLEHVFDVFNFVGHVARIVRPGGLVLLRVPNIAYLKNRVTLVRGGLPVTSSWFGPVNDLTAWRTTWGWDGGHLHCFTLATLRDLLTDAGLALVGWGDPGARFASLRSRLPSVLCGNLCVLAERCA